jgi:hypothetical protein
MTYTVMAAQLASAHQRWPMRAARPRARSVGRLPNRTASVQASIAIAAGEKAAGSEVQPSAPFVAATLQLVRVPPQSQLLDWQALRWWLSPSRGAQPAHLGQPHAATTYHLRLEPVVAEPESRVEGHLGSQAPMTASASGAAQAMRARSLVGSAVVSAPCIGGGDRNGVGTIGVRSDGVETRMIGLRAWVLEPNSSRMVDPTTMRATTTPAATNQVSWRLVQELTSPPHHEMRGGPPIGLRVVVERSLRSPLNRGVTTRAGRLNDVMYGETPRMPRQRR